MNPRLKPGLKAILGLLLLMIAPSLSNITTNYAPDNEPNISAQIKSQTNDGLITFTGLAINFGGKEYLCTYRMTAKRIGNAGQSSNLQSGSVLLKPGNTTQLSKMTISATNEDSYKVTLQILFNKSIIDSDSISYSPD